MTLRNLVIASFIFSLGLIASPFVVAEEGLQLPADPAAWLNSQPLSREQLKGKAVVLYYFEETCPRCRDRWPEIIAMADKYKDKPVAFIAVNSGNPSPVVEAYLKQNEIPLRTVVDTQRAMEEPVGIDQISLRNIYQFVTISPQGEIARAGWQTPQVEERIDEVVADAKWSIEPETIPESMNDLWRAVEFGDFASIADPLRKFAVGDDEAEKAAAFKLHGQIKEQLAADVAAARKLQEDGQAWRAYKAYGGAAKKYVGYGYEAKFAQVRKQLESDEQVAKEIMAQKRWDKINSLKITNTAALKRAMADMKKLAEDLPGTEGAEVASSTLEKLEAAFKQ